jgi:glucokinase
MKSVLGIEIGGTKLQIVGGMSDGTIHHRRRFDVDPKAGADGIRTAIQQAVPELLKAFPAQAIGVGFGGPVDRTKGSIACSHQIQGWSGFPMKQWLEGLFGVTAIVDNDANVAALGEALLGAGRGTNPVFYVTLGSGVGGGLISGGQIYHGKTPGESEIGHLRLDPSGVLVEHRCSGWAVDLRIREAAHRHPQSLLSRAVSGCQGGEARHLKAALDSGDELAQSLLADVCQDLAFALSHVTHLVHPETIVLGGGLSLVGEWLRSGVAHRLPAFLMEVFQPGPRIVLASLAEDAVPVGALLLADRGE